MQHSNIVGQERVVHTLKRTLVSGRVAHAYIFHGPDGVGKKAAAFALARALQCVSLVDGEACNVCGPCSKALKGLHPDIHVLMPTTNDATHDDISARLMALAQDPYVIVDFQRRPTLDGTATSSNKQVYYSVEMVNESLRRPMSFHRVEGEYRVGIILDADKMKTEASNAFLKLLEEPGSKTVFILTTDRIDHILPTILSRCQQMRFDTLSVAEITEALMQRDLVDEQSGPVIARMADGSLSRALDLAGSEELPLVRDEVLSFLRLSFQGRGDVVTSAVDSLSSMGREHTKFFLLVMLGILRDLFLLSGAQSTELIVNVDQIETLSKFVGNLPDARIDYMIEAVEQVSYLLERNVNTRLALIALSRVLSNAMRGDRAEIALSLAS